MTLWSIFWRTFAQLATAALLAVQGLDWATSNGLKSNGIALGLALLLALIGALGAVLWSYASQPAVTAMEKALRSAAQALAGVLGAVVLNEAADLIALPKFLIGSVATVILAFAVTYFSNQGTVPPATTSP